MHKQLDPSRKSLGTFIAFITGSAAVQKAASAPFQGRPPVPASTRQIKRAARTRREKLSSYSRVLAYGFH